MPELSGLSVTRQGRVVVDDVSLTVEPGKVTALLGANGAGKSELDLRIAGLLPVTGGKVLANGVDLTGASPNRVRVAGVAAVPEGHQILTQLSVEDNLRAAATLWRSRDAGLCLVAFPELAERKPQRAGTMSGGQQQMLAIGQALMRKPSYLLIAEMSLGLAPLIVKRLTKVVGDLTRQGIGVLLVEQFVEVALQLASHLVVLRTGRVRFSVHPDE